MGSSPHTRGARICIHENDSYRRIIPAYAGSTRPAPRPMGLTMDHPRIRGEHYLPEIFTCLFCRIIPAYAGSTAESGLGDGVGWDHPRIRGEHYGPDRLEALGEGSSPHTRGARINAGQGRSLLRIIPAYAGSTNLWQIIKPQVADHPRIRGEHVMTVMPSLPLLGSSPHTRGALGVFVGDTARKRIIPAYAGSTRRGQGICRSPRDHPRIRGEHLWWLGRSVA